MTVVRPGADEHGRLREASVDALAALVGAENELTALHGQAGWHPDWQAGRRLGHLAGHLRTAVAASEMSEYASAFSIVRTALEHHLIDELLFLATRYEQHIPDVDDVRFQEWETDLAARTEPWTSGVEAMRRRGRGVTLVRRGVDVLDADGTIVRQLSAYYSWLQHQEPLMGRPSDQEMFDDGVIDTGVRRHHAERNESLYRHALTWPAIRQNLELNDLWSELDLRRLEVHYRFTSTFVHATDKGYAMLDHRSDRHVCTELVLLYVATLAAREIRIFARYLDKGGSTTWTRSDHAQAVADEAAACASHLWFPNFSNPDQYDYWKEANRRKFLEQGGQPHPTSLRPEELGPADLEGRYYSDPLDRLTDMHRPAREMLSGFEYSPRWA
jgi:hypothetical protein